MSGSKLITRQARSDILSALKEGDSCCGRCRKPGIGSIGTSAIVQTALDQWMPTQCHLAHPLLDLCDEIGERCTDAHFPRPSRNTVAQLIQRTGRWQGYLGSSSRHLDQALPTN